MLGDRVISVVLPGYLDIGTKGLTKRYIAAMETDRDCYNFRIPKRWFTFSLGKVLLFLLVVSLPISWVARRLHQSKRESAAVLDIEAAGGKIVYHVIPSTRLLRRWIGADFFRQVVQVDLSRTKVADVSFLSNLPHVLAIRLDWTDVDDITPLSKCSKLIYLSLEGTGVSDVSPLSKLNGLKELNLSGTPVIDLRALPVSELQRLSLCKCKAIDLAPLNKAGQLAELNLYKSSPTDWMQLHRLTGLRTLNIRGCDAKSIQIGKLRRSLPQCEIDYSLGRTMD